MKNILITGVSKGIGRTLATHFHNLGYAVYGGYKHSGIYQEEEALAESLKAELQNLTLLPYDLADRALVEQLIQQMKGLKLEAIVHNAGEFQANTKEAER